MSADDTSDMFSPPVNRAMQVLDRKFFTKTVNTAAARIFSPKDISTVRTQLSQSGDVLLQSRIAPIRPDPEEARAQKGARCLVLRPGVAPNDATTWSPILRELESKGTVGVIPYALTLDYDYFSYTEIMKAIIPEPEESVHDDLPAGFTQTGHIAHLNLRRQYDPWKFLIAQVLADKNPNVTTVVNKLQNVGSESVYRTFPYEVLAGENNMDVTVHEQDCVFSFNFANVYWNSRLETEHRRLCDLFAEGDAVCDVMAGVGPFAIPAGKKKCFVWANDLNPDSYSSLLTAITANKVHKFVKPFNTDGLEFIRKATADLLTAAPQKVDIFAKVRHARSAPKAPKPSQTLIQPRIFAHYVMNLPATAITFLPSFIGLYANVPGMPASAIRKLFYPHTDLQLPMIHVHCFSTKSDDNVREGKEICSEIGKQLGCKMTPETMDGFVWDVRDVAPTKRMFCASFRLPVEVAFRDV